jgi:hypothetical protein
MNLICLFGNVTALVNGPELATSEVSYSGPQIAANDPLQTFWLNESQRWCVD